MRKSIVAVVALFGSFIVSAEAQVRGLSLAQTCPKVQDVGSASGTIYKNSAPVRANSSLTAPIVYFRKEPTLIFGRRNFTGSTHTIFDSSGNSLGRCPVTSAHGAAGRARCTLQTASVRRNAVRNTGSPTVYFKISRSLCVKVEDAGKCYGSAKGLCNQIIK